ncbi:UDP-D-xylose:L-fucose alpha-1,3-D-xylosyltransferase MGP4-like [Hibiscus syriacus]|uniref:UDP-D-xylose:L-fucose alpha-1,3-D-xylosyltransferase MGP4-like n=1 Tax=Hibiscus syriacus TaxID=106335 RepID=UPI0019236E28|nr:UDP-D-xylose:L-fucose alpha-1,3-D-xylosyltransferase MGP4-like [Hibiscus syriacus]
MARWQILLSKFDIVYMNQKDMKESAIANFLERRPLEDYELVKFEFPNEDLMSIFAAEENAPKDKDWKMNFDGASNVVGYGIGNFKLNHGPKQKKANDQPAFNWALLKTSGVVDLYLLPQAAFPTGGLYFKNKTWVQQTRGMHVIIHNNYILGFEKKTKLFRDHGLWLVDDHALESPLDGL